MTIKISRLHLLSLVASSCNLSLDVEPSGNNGQVQVTISKGNGDLHSRFLASQDNDAIDREIKKLVPGWDGVVEVV